MNEYGYHIARELQQDPLLSLTILADELEAPEPELEGYNVKRVWGMNLLSNPARLLRAVRDIKPDVVWFNLLFPPLAANPFLRSQASLSLRSPGSPAATRTSRCII